MSHFPEKLRNLPPFEGPFDAHKLAAEGCEVLLASYPAGTNLEPHTHDTHNVGVITQGVMMITMTGQERRYAVGDWYEIPAGTVHSARTEVDTSEIEFWFHV
ncbi:MAG: cupin domain-containing protein [Acidiferrobacterales bacterium]